MIRFKIMLTALIAVTLASCKFDVDLGDLGPGIKGDGNVVTESRNNDTPFTGIEVSRGIELVVEQSDEKSITVTADKNLQNHISTDINNGILTITSDVNIDGASTKKVTVKLPKITSLQASSAATVMSNNTIKGQNIGLSSSSGSDLKISLEADNVTAECSSGSTMKLHGKALKLETDTSSGSVLDAEALLANDIISDASSGSVTEVRPLMSLKASASSGSSINYHNEPKTIDKDTSSGGSITKQ